MPHKTRGPFRWGDCGAGAGKGPLQKDQSCHVPEMRAKILLDRGTYFHWVIPAQARIQAAFNWTPAWAGVTIV